MRRSICCLLKRESGSNTVELALLTAFILLPLLVGAVDLGRAYYVAIEVNSAAHAGALYGSQNPFIPSSDPVNIPPLLNTAGIAAAATLDAADIAMQTPNVSLICECYNSSGTAPISCKITANPCGTGNPVYLVTVTTKAIYTPIISFPPIIPASYTFNGKSSMRAAY